MTTLNVATSLLRDVSATASDIDAGLLSPRTHLASLGDAGLLDLGIDDLLVGGAAATDVRDPATLIANLAGECMSTAFSLWAHRMVLDYLARGRRSPASEDVFGDLRAGRRPGSTAMASGLKWLAGLGDLSVAATPTDDGWVLDGVVPWASNLTSDAVVVLPARAPDCVLVVRVDASDLDIVPATGLLALNATFSGTIRLHDVIVGHDQVLADDLAPFARSFRPTFLVLQTAFCVGVTHRSLSEAEAALDRAENAVFAGDLTALQRDANEHYERWDALAADITSGGIADLLHLRLEASHLACRATRLEAVLAGGRGYVADSGASRRFREAAFLPVQSPSEGQLRWELSLLA